MSERERESEREVRRQLRKTGRSYPVSAFFIPLEFLCTFHAALLAASPLSRRCNIPDKHVWVHSYRIAIQPCIQNTVHTLPVSRRGTKEMQNVSFREKSLLRLKVNLWTSATLPSTYKRLGQPWQILMIGPSDQHGPYLLHVPLLWLNYAKKNTTLGEAGKRTHIATSPAVVPSACDNIKRLLATHAHSYKLISHPLWCSSAQ